MMVIVFLLSFQGRLMKEKERGSSRCQWHFFFVSIDSPSFLFLFDLFSLVNLPERMHPGATAVVFVLVQLENRLRIEINETRSILLFNWPTDRGQSSSDRSSVVQLRFHIKSITNIAINCFPIIFIWRFSLSLNNFLLLFNFRFPFIRSLLWPVWHDDS